MLAVEDYLLALDWARSVGGLHGLIARADANTKAVADFVRDARLDRLSGTDPSNLVQYRLSV